MFNSKILTVQLAAIALVAVAFVGCSGSDSEPYEAAEEIEMEAAAPVMEPVSETLVASKLAGADLADGTEDMVVSRCPGCALAMEGSADYPVSVEGYELHFCSESCRHGFEDDLMANIARLEIPER